MSAVPKKKLCWNCEGNVARNIDNCPYCGVYLHATEEEENSSLWSPSYVPSSKTEEIPSPLYQISSEDESSTKEAEIFEAQETPSSSFDWRPLFAQFRRDVFPILFLMAGSVFFLFGAVLLLFSQEGTLTLQWEEGDALYFLALAIPLIIFGWAFLQRLEND